MMDAKYPQLKAIVEDMIAQDGVESAIAQLLAEFLAARKGKVGTITAINELIKGSAATVLVLTAVGVRMELESGNKTEG